MPFIIRTRRSEPCTATENYAMGYSCEETLEKIRIERIVGDLWDLVNVPSPTQHERKAVLLFGEKLDRIGVRVELEETYPDSPSVVGILDGQRPGATFQLAGHLDHIDKPHPPPERDGKSVCGRGVSDMKNGMAGILEILRVLKETGCDFPGRVLVTAYGLHEAPLGFGEGLRVLIDKGIKGDAALVAEGSSEAAIVTGCGMAIWQIRLSRNGEVCHELERASDDDELFNNVLTLAHRIEQHRRTLKAEHSGYPLLGGESVFLGQFHYGDFYNRVPRQCLLEGTYRWHPDRTLKDVRAAFNSLLFPAGKPATVTAGISTEETWQLVGESYEMDETEDVVKALRRSYETVYGAALPVRGTKTITDGARLMAWGNVPAVLWGFDNRTAHGDYESVRIDRLKRSCEVGLLTLLTYLGHDR